MNDQRPSGPSARRFADPSARRSAVLSRRSALATFGAAAAGSLAGCLGGLTGGGSGSKPDPISLAGDLACDHCGMVISKHPGPNGQIFYENHHPDGHDNPARFESIKECLFTYYFQHKHRGWKADVIYVTDYSTVDYHLSNDGSKTFISSSVDPDSFTDGKRAHYVVDSDVYGAMSKDFVPFSDRGDADSFASDHGGDVVAFGDVTPTLAGK